MPRKKKLSAYDVAQVGEVVAYVSMAHMALHEASMRMDNRGEEITKNVKDAEILLRQLSLDVIMED